MGGAATIFTFDNDSQGTTTAFTDTVNGLSATFTSPSDPAGFSVQPSIFDTLTGNVLGSPLFQNNVPLTISFNANLSAITLLFATADFNTPSPLTLTAYEGNAPVGGATLPGMFLNGFLFPEGEIAFSGGNFNSVVISSNAPAFAIDNVQVVQAAATPEPNSEWMLGLGLVALGMPRLRRRGR
jgi:hypothetical protein